MTKRFCHAGLCLTLTCVVLTIAAARVAQGGNNVRRTPLVDSIEKTIRSTVNIHTEKRQKSLDVVFSAGKASKINGMGTGVVIDERGYLATNYHVVQDVERLRVTTYDGAEYDARVLAYDARRDLAVIKINPRLPLSVMPMGTSSDLMLGEDVVAIGNAFGYESTVTRGIISHLSRDVEVNEEQAYENLIQIDAAINPGNSGGPLLNATGEVIGINVAIRAGAQRIGFAIPIDDARKTIARLIDIERHHQTSHGITGLDYKQGAERKLIVQSLLPNSSAAESGMLKGDVIIKSGDVDVVDGVDLERSLFNRVPGDEVPVIVLRDGEEKALTLRLNSLTADRIRSNRQSIASAPEVARSIQNVAERAWKVLGVRLAELPSGLPATNQPYRGGMRVVEVRGQSPAESNGIRSGDILVGLHIWETVNEQNIEYVLNHPQLPKLNPLKFYILRNGETLFGHFRLVASR